jgi:hypothetical protein
MAVVTANLVAEWVGKLAKTGTLPGNNADPTSTWDDLKGVHDATVSNTSTWTTARGWAGDGTAGDPYRLVNNGTNMTATPTDNADLNSASFSVEAWVNLIGTVANTQSIFNCRGDDGTAKKGYALIFTTNQNFASLGIGNGTAYTYVASAGSLLTGFHHVVFTYDGSYVTPYINGSAQAATAYSTFVPKTGSQLGLLISPSAYDRLNGAVPTVRVYSSALSSAEVSANYAAGVTAASTDAAAGFTGLTVTRLLNG